MMLRRAALALACVAVMAALADGALLPWLGNGRRGRDEAAAAVAPLSDVGLMADPFRILEHIPFGFDRDNVAMVSMARVDWRETPDSHEIAVDVPGMRKEDLKIEIEDNRMLRISGERRREEEQKGDHWHREERSYGRFWRQFRLPDNADLDTVAASLDNGVLAVRFRKLAPDQIKGPRVVGISGVDSDGAAKKSIGAGAGAGEEHQTKKVEL
ncbi:23.2 kDa heat shock protein-like [Phragmites australis]|uniref:23.2 kDa heat shock protein-like n=1 Tax=Phragmites australis TaxID=29695 RepID=UPI002D76A935|nr:23.2 kDa heat shock protein-like [Phragmites australis]